MSSAGSDCFEFGFDGSWANKFPEWEVRCKGRGSCLCPKLLYPKLPIEGNEVISEKNEVKRLREKNLEKNQAYRYRKINPGTERLIQ